MNAGNTAPSPTHYRITEAFNHKTLERGDIVSIVETPDYLTNYIFRYSDATLHLISDEFDKYPDIEPLA